jgi:hypothetical protein
MEPLKSDLPNLYEIMKQLAPVLVGGIISLFSALVVLWFKSYSDKKLANANLKVQRNNDARIGLAKLINICNQFHSINSSISKQLPSLDVAKQTTVDPALVVTALIGGNLSVDVLSAQETEFLLHSNSGGLLTDIHLIQRRLATTFEILKRYNSDREKLDAFIEEYLDEEVDFDGPIVTAKFPVSKRRRYEFQVMKLNRLLGDLMTTTESDLHKAQDLLDEFQRKGAEFFGASFPSVRSKIDH